jgi:hypothetical protein
MGDKKQRTNNQLSEKSLPDKSLFNFLYQLKIPFTIRIGLDKKESNIRLIAYSIANREIILSNLEEVRLSNINQIEISGKNSINFFKKVIPNLPNSNELQQFEGKRIIIYPFGKRGYIKAHLIKTYPYFFILHTESIKRLGKRMKRLHSYIIKYKLFVSAYSLFRPYPDDLIEEGTPYDTIKAGKWREEFTEITGYLKEILNKEKSKLLTFALKDGREITGVFEKHRSMNNPFSYRVFNPDNPKESITIFKHAIDDLWEN